MEKNELPLVLIETSNLSSSLNLVVLVFVLCFFFHMPLEVNFCIWFSVFSIFCLSGHALNFLPPLIFSGFYLLSPFLQHHPLIFAKLRIQNSIDLIPYTDWLYKCSVRYLFLCSLFSLRDSFFYLPPTVAFSVMFHGVFCLPWSLFSRFWLMSFVFRFLAFFVVCLIVFYYMDFVFFLVFSIVSRPFYLYLSPSLWSLSSSSHVGYAQRVYLIASVKAHILSSFVYLLSLIFLNIVINLQFFIYYPLPCISSHLWYPFLCAYIFLTCLTTSSTSILLKF